MPSVRSYPRRVWMRVARKLFWCACASVAILSLMPLASKSLTLFAMSVSAIWLRAADFWVISVSMEFTELYKEFAVAPTSFLTLSKLRAKFSILSCESSERLWLFSSPTRAVISPSPR